MRAGMAKVQEGDGRGEERGRMRLGRGLVKKGVGRGRSRFEGFGRGKGMLRGRKEHVCGGDECYD